MAGVRFDDWTMELATGGRSRRAALRLLAGGAVVGGRGEIGRTVPAAKCTKPGKRCGRGDKCCGGGKCKGKKCVCTGGQVACAGACCPPDQECIGGACCPAERLCGVRCCANGDICVDPDNGTCATGAGACQGGDDVCAETGNPVVCNGVRGCVCLRRFEGGQRCGRLNGCSPAVCETDADCADFGLGSFCYLKTGDGCCAGRPVGGGFCATTCQLS